MVSHGAQKTIDLIVNDAPYRGDWATIDNPQLFYCVGSMRNVKASGSGGNDGKCAI